MTRGPDLDQLLGQQVRFGDRPVGERLERADRRRARVTRARPGQQYLAQGRRVQWPAEPEPGVRADGGADQDHRVRAAADGEVGGGAGAPGEQVELGSGEVQAPLMEAELAEFGHGRAEPVPGGLLVLLQEGGADQGAGQPVRGGDRQAQPAGEVRGAQVGAVVVETVQQSECPLDGLRAGRRALDGGCGLGHGTSRSVRRSGAITEVGSRLWQLMLPDCVGDVAMEWHS